jgi:hypothetical protein
MHNKSIVNGRLSFRIRSQMVDNIPANFKNKFRNDKQGLICKYCPTGDNLSQSHCLVCPSWQELRVGLDLKQIRDLLWEVVNRAGKDGQEGDQGLMSGCIALLLAECLSASDGCSMIGIILS